ncbi:hypothetical protein C8J38_11058 [Rhizobium sp. PP-WC-2G-219]|nr:hypothetical protein C8J38_11058 [Rhizobium sp. PP-WC-2G-219]
MGQITDLAKAIYGDGPASAPSQPPKADIRTLFGVIDLQLISMLNGIVIGNSIAYATRASLFADLARPVGTLGIVYADSNPAYIGVYTKVGASGTGSWSLTGITLPGGIAADVANVIAGLAAEITARQNADRVIDAKVTDFSRQSGKRYRQIGGTRRKHLFAGDNFGPTSTTKVMSIGIPIEVDCQTVGAFAFWIVGATGITKIRTRLTKRVRANNPSVFVAPGGVAGDVVVQNWTDFDVRDCVADPLLYDKFQQAILPISGIGPIVAATDLLFVDVMALDANNQSIPFGAARGRTYVNDTVDPPWKRGVFAADVAGPYFLGGDGTELIACALYEAVIVSGSAGGHTGVDAEYRPILNGPLDLNQSDAFDAAAWRITFPQFSLDTQPEPIASDFLSAQSVGNVARVPINNFRYDIFGIDPSTGGLAYGPGVQRQGDPNGYISVMAEQTRNVPLFNILVKPSGVELVEVWNFKDFVMRGEEAKHLAHLEYNRRCLATFLRKLNSGAAIRYAWYGDSIGAVSKTTSPNTPPNYYAPNGPNRDVVDYFETAQSDTRATYPRFDGDGGVGAHVHLGMNWHIMAFLRARYGAILDPRNWCISGTTSDNNVISGDVPNGTYPARLNALIADDPDFVVWQFGMNEIPSDRVYNNYLVGISALRSAGIDVLGITCPRPNRLNGTTLLEWQWQTQQQIQAFRRLGVAYIDLSRISGPGREGAIGISADTMCEATMRGHPGAYEFKKFGEYASLTFA